MKQLKVLVVGTPEDFKRSIVMPELDIEQVSEVHCFHGLEEDIKENTALLSTIDIVVTRESWHESDPCCILIQIARLLKIDVVSYLSFTKYAQSDNN